MTFTPQTDSSSPVQSDGNNVNIDSEMSDMSQNALQYDALVELAGQRMKILSDAIGAGQ
jgi:flagellar basal-body rod protein FlgB